VQTRSKPCAHLPQHGLVVWSALTSQGLKLTAGLAIGLDFTAVTAA